MGGGSRSGYFIRKAFRNFAAHRLVTALTVSTITLALLIIALFLLVFVNMEGTVEQWSRKVVVTVYFEREPLPQELAQLKSRIASVPGTGSLVYVSKADALKRFRDRLKGQESLLEGVAADILPASLDISLNREHRSTEAVNIYVARLKKIEGVGEVQYGEEWVRKFLTFFNFIRFLGFLIASFLLLAVLFIVSNTIRLTILARKDELEIQALVGATSLFIKAPFLIEGVVQGAAGAVIAVLLLTGGYFALLSNAANFLAFNPAEAGLIFLPPAYLVALILGGAFLGFVGSLLSLKKFISI
jgi:cell division transport system permease protein